MSVKRVGRHFFTRLWLVYNGFEVVERLWNLTAAGARSAIVLAIYALWSTSAGVLAGADSFIPNNQVIIRLSLPRGRFATRRW